MNFVIIKLIFANIGLNFLLLSGQTMVEIYSTEGMHTRSIKLAPKLHHT
jgi:hypothetical protein